MKHDPRLVEQLLARRARRRLQLERAITAVAIAAAACAFALVPGRALVSLVLAS